MRRSPGAAFAALLLLAAAPPALAQTGSVTGRVTDARSGASIDGVEVVVVGHRLSGLSRSDGRFLLAGIPPGPLTLRAQRIGYAPLERRVAVTAGETLVVDLALSIRPLDLDGIVVTRSAAGARRREIGHTVGRVEIEGVNLRHSTPSDLLQGALPGVEVTGGSGEAGQGKQIRLRGNRSMVLSNQPLIYVDGIRMMEGAFPSELFDGGSLAPAGANVTTSPLDLVSVGDIERIEVVKGPAASTFFGTGSANGVIQIFTRSGRPGQASWTAEIMQGTGWVRPFGANGVDYLHAEHFMRGAWWGRGYDGGAASGPCVTDDPRWKGANASADGPCRWPGSQWYRTVRLAVGGGGERLSYHLSGDLQDDTHALPLDRLERQGARMNLGALLSPRLEVQLRGAYSRTATTNTVSGNSFEGLILSSMRQDRNLLSSGDPRVIADLLENRNRQDIGRLTTGVTTTFVQGPTLSHRLTIGHDRSGQDLRSQRVEGFPFSPEGGLTTRRWERRLTTVDYVATRVFTPRPDLRSTLSLGGQWVGDALESVLATTEGRPGAEPGEAVRTAGSTSNTGLFAQNVLDLDDRWFLTLGLRMDRHRTRGGSFLRVDPVVSGAWVVSDEPFWPASLGVLRLRSAWGRSRSAAGPFLPAVTHGGDQPVPGPEAERLVAPERVSEWELGLDGATRGGRLSMGFTYYRQAVADALVSVADAPETPPFRRELRNLGRVRNHGIELELDAVVVNAPRWGLDIGLGITTNHSKLLDLGGAAPFWDLSSRLIVGHPVPVSYGRRVADPDAVHGPWTPDRYVGGAAESFPLGPHLPTHFVAPTLSLRAPGGVLLGARGEYRGGNVRFVDPVRALRGTVSPLCLPWYLDPGASLDLRPETPDLWRERCTPQGAADYWFDGGYFKLRSVTALVPVRFLFPGAVQEATLSITLANAWSWHREVPWWDLEILANGGANDDGLGSSERVPASATLTFGLRVRF